MLPKVLDRHLRLNIDGKIIIYGAIVKASFWALIKVVNRRLYLLSVICKERLLRSVRDVGTICDDIYTGLEGTFRVFAGLSETKEILWTCEGRTQFRIASRSALGSFFSFAVPHRAS